MVDVNPNDYLNRLDKDPRKAGFVLIKRNPTENEVVFSKNVDQWKRGVRTTDIEGWYHPPTNLVFHRRLVRYNSFDSQSSKISSKNYLCDIDIRSSINVGGELGSLLKEGKVREAEDYIKKQTKSNNFRFHSSNILSIDKNGFSLWNNHREKLWNYGYNKKGEGVIQRDIEKNIRQIKILTISKR